MSAAEQQAWIWAWLPEQGRGQERFAHRAMPGGHVLEGEITAELDGAAIEARYVVEVDSAWRTRRVRIELTSGGATRKLDLRANGGGRWSDADGIWIPALDGCVDVDISLTPSTNTLPIRRLGLAIGAEAEISVAYILAPQLNLRAGRQVYRRLATDAWRFSAPESGFTADLVTDAEGFVIEYPGLFRRA